MAQTSDATPAIPPNTDNDEHVTPLPNDTTTAAAAAARRPLAVSANAVLRSIISGTVDSVDEEDVHENASNASNNGRQRTRRRVSPLYICVPVTLFTLFVIFAGTLAGAIVSWHQYEKLRLHDAWFVRSCITVKVRVRKAPKTNKWRPEADVRGFGLQNATEVVTAFWGRNDGYHVTEEYARQLIKQLPQAGLRSACWVKYNSPHTVSMIKVARTPQSQEEVYLNMAWGSSFFAAVSGFLLLTFTVNFVQRALVYAVTGGDRAPATNEQGEGNTPTKRTTCLSPTQTRWVASQFGNVVEGSTMPDEWVCSICLEECEETQRLRVIVLPCNHRFHSKCLKKWLRRGSPTCPLCNFDVHSLFDDDGVPLDNQGNGVLSPTATETQIEAVVLDMRSTTNLAHDEDQDFVIGATTNPPPQPEAMTTTTTTTQVQG